MKGFHALCIVSYAVLFLIAASEVRVIPSILTLVLLIIHVLFVFVYEEQCYAARSVPSS